VDPSQLFLVQIRLPIHSLSEVQSPALTSQGFSAEHLFEAFRTSKVSRNPKFQFKLVSVGLWKFEVVECTTFGSV
jgi:hypothetical protein